MSANRNVIFKVCQKLSNYYTELRISPKLQITSRDKNHSQYQHCVISSEELDELSFPRSCHFNDIVKFWKIFCLLLIINTFEYLRSLDPWTGSFRVFPIFGTLLEFDSTQIKFNLILPTPKYLVHDVPHYFLNNFSKYIFRNWKIPGNCKAWRNDRLKTNVTN